MIFTPPRMLLEQDVVSDFDCEVPELNTWFAESALKSQAKGDARTYVSFDSETAAAAGFYALSASGVNREKARGWLGRNAPKTIPVILLGRLGVAKFASGVGLGRSLLVDATRRAAAVAETVGARALVVEASDGNAGDFYAHNGFTLVPGTENLYAFRL